MFLKDAGRSQQETWPSSVGEYAATFSPREKAYGAISSFGSAAVSLALPAGVTLEP
jgi:hypothetical protein